MTRRGNGSRAGGSLGRTLARRQGGRGVNGAAGTNGAAGANGAKGTNGSDLELLPLVELASDHPCVNCAQCCKYIAIEIDEPTTMREYDYMVWYLVHPGVSVFVDWDNDWFVKFDTRCQHLQPNGMCGIYETRPGICRDFDWKDCEQHVKDEPPDKWLFHSAEEFVAWLQKQRPKTYQKFRGVPARAPSQEDREGAPAPQGHRAPAAAVLKPVRLFVYGTLRPGLAQGRLAAQVKALRHLGSARVRGRLLDLGAYPGAVLDAGAAGEIVGELLEVTQADLLAALDAYEGFDPLRPQDSLFVRTEATARCEDGRETRCQIYVYVQARDGAPELPDGEWRERNAPRPERA